MTVAEYKQGIQILLDAFLTDPRTWDKLSKEYRERMMNNYTRFWANRNAQRFHAACKFFGENSTNNKMPTNGQLVDQYRQMVIERDDKFEGEVVGCPQELRDKMEQWANEKPFDMNEVIDNDVPF